MTMRQGAQVRIRDLSAYRGRVGTLLLDRGFFNLHGRYVVQVDGEAVYCTKVSYAPQPFLASQSTQARVTYVTGEIE